jgi:hypothetical protein
MTYAVKRQLARVLLFVHFLGLTLCLGTIFTNIMIERHTSGGSLELLSIGRDLVTLSSHALIQSGFLVTVFSGILIALLRYGLRAPLWAWIKLGVSTVIVALVIFALDPASTAATEWARWSAAHGQLAPEYLVDVARAGRYGIAVLLLLLVTTSVAIWKPMWPSLRGRRDSASPLSTSADARGANAEA